MAECQPNMLICTEARITCDVTDPEIKIDGYNTLRSNADSRHSGGVVVYYREHMNITLLTDHVDGYDHMLVFEVLSSCCRGVWVGIYHSPSASDTDFLSNFESAVEPLLSMCKPLTITGDFNINMHANNPVNTYKQRLKRFESSRSMKQLITDFTRITATSKTTVDLFFTNNHTLTAHTSENNVIADHKMIIVSKRIIYRDYHRKRIPDRSKLTASNFQQLIRPKLDSCVFNDDINERARLIEFSQ